MNHLKKRIKSFEAQITALKVRKLEILQNSVMSETLLTDKDREEIIDITAKINDIGLMIYETNRQLQYFRTSSQSTQSQERQ